MKLKQEITPWSISVSVSNWPSDHLYFSFGEQRAYHDSFKDVIYVIDLDQIPTNCSKCNTTNTKNRYSISKCISASVNKGNTMIASISSSVRGLRLGRSEAGPPTAV
jgi:hypothetical protein